MGMAFSQSASIGIKPEQATDQPPRESRWNDLNESEGIWELLGKSKHGTCTYAHLLDMTGDHLA